MEPTYRAKPPHFVPSKRTGAKKNEGTWRVEIVDSDGKFHKSKSFKTKAAANQWGPEYLADMRRGIDSGMTDIRDAQLTVAGLIAKYNDDAGKLDNVQRSRDIQWWKDAHGHYQLVHYRPEHVLKALKDYQASPCEIFDRATGGTKAIERKRSPASRNRKLAALRAVFKWATSPEINLVSVSPAHKVKNTPENNERKKFLNREQVIQLLTLARDDEWSRAYLFFLGLIHTGARRNEWLSMTWQRINLDEATAYLPTSKNGEPRILPLTPDIIAELKRIRASKPQIAGLVFPSLMDDTKPYDARRCWKRLLVSMDMDYPMGDQRYIRMHDLRHTAASLLAGRGASLTQVGEVLGHKSVQSTKRYSHLCVNAKKELVASVMAGLSLEVAI